MNVRERTDLPPCGKRKCELRDGLLSNWCYAIGCCEVGDMPCECPCPRIGTKQCPNNKQTQKMKGKEK